MQDKFKNTTASLNMPATAAFEIAPDDGSMLPFATRGLMLGTSGDARVQMLDGDVVTLRGLSPGILYPIRIVQVYQTGTTATQIVGLH